MLEEKVLQTIKKYELIKKGDNIVVGVSGGPDSMTLLNVLINLKNTQKITFNIVVAHINHMIRKEADSETEYVQDFCEKNNIQCFIKKAKVEQIAKEQKIGTEEAGRNLRYNFFDEVANKTNSNKIAIAHNANDNAETVLMNIIRGAGTSGLKGIEPIRDNKYIRPLIEITRQEIEEYCEEEKLDPKIDKTNFENTYTRNKVRNLLIPYIKENYNPNIISSLNRLSEIAREENSYIEKQAKIVFKELTEDASEQLNKELREQLNKEKNEQLNVKEEQQLGKEDFETNLQPEKQVIISLKKFNAQELIIRKRIVLLAIQKILGTTQGVEKINIEDIIKLCSNNIGNKYLIPNKNLKVLVKNKKIFFIKI